MPQSQISQGVDGEPQDQDQDCVMISPTSRPESKLLGFGRGTHE